MDIHYDPSDPAFQADPYPTYARLREAGRAHRVVFAQPDGRAIPIWLLPHFEDCAAVLRADPRFSAHKNLGAAIPVEPPTDRELEPFERIYYGLLIFRDPPLHTRLRNLVSKAFTPRMVERLRPHIARLVVDLLDAKAPDGEMDLMADLAVPLPIIVIAELLGVPVEDRAQLKVWSDSAAMMLDGTLREENEAEALASLVELVGYLKGVVEARRKEPADDLISGLVAAQEADDSLDDYEILATCALILGAGHETTTNLIGNGMLALLRDPVAFERLHREPGLVPSAVEELLRYDSPVQVTSRLALEDVDLAGVRIRKGDEVDAMLASANRDPARFSEPDRLRLDRPDNRHLAFGYGPHFCLGAGLARLEGQLAVQALVQRFPRMRLLIEDPPQRPGIVLRGRTTLPVALAERG